MWQNILLFRVSTSYDSKWRGFSATLLVFYYTLYVFQMLITIMHGIKIQQMFNLW